MKRKYGCHKACPVEFALEIIGGKWKGVVLHHLIDGKKRFNQLRRVIPSVSQRMLTRQLRELEQHKIITRTVFPEIPPKVEYELSATGMSLIPILRDLRNWGAQNRNILQEK